LGAAGVWHLAAKYGHFLAAVAPMSGQSEWPRDTWPPRSAPRQDVARRLAALPIRAYHIDIDTRAGSPVVDMSWLAWGCTERSYQLDDLPGMTDGSTLVAQVREWFRSGANANWELWLVRGPLKDWPFWNRRGGDNHCIWYRVYPDEAWDLVTWMLKHSVPPETPAGEVPGATGGVPSGDAANQLRAGGDGAGGAGSDETPTWQKMEPEPMREPGWG